MDVAKVEQVKSWLGTGDEVQAVALLEATGWDLEMCREMLAESLQVSVAGDVVFTRPGFAVAIKAACDNPV